MAKTSFYTGSGTDSNAVSALESLKDQAQTSATNAASSATAAASSASTAASNATAAASSAASAAASAASLNTDVATQSEKGLMSSADKTKLDGVESGATADQTAAEIKTAYESNSDTNAFTDALQTKLSGIEAGATGDQTAAEIKTAYESNSDTNAFTDAEQTKLSGIEASADVTDATNVQAAGALMDSEVTSLSGIKTLTVPDSTTVSTFGASLVDDADAAAARTTLGLGTAATTASTAYATAAQGSTADAALPKAGGTMTGAITFASGQTFDGRDVSADGTKLDTIETNADVTDATNVQAAGALMDSEVTNLAQVKAFSSSDYATAAQGSTADAALPKAGGTMTGNIVMSGAQTVDGRDLSVDGTKLDGIESGATADQTAAEIKTAYESNSDTNAFTDALQTKLTGIEASADVTDATNVQAAGALMDSELTSEASVKAINQGLATTDSPTFAGLTSNGDIVFEGATADDFETTVTVTDPTADRTITLPDNTGTVVIRDGDNSVGNSIKVLDGPNSGSTYDGVVTLAGAGEGFLVGTPSVGESQIVSSRTGVTSGNLQIYGTNTSDKVSFKRGIVSIDTNSGFEFTDGTNDLTVDHSALNADRTITLPDQTGTAMLWQSKWPDDPGSATDNIAIGGGALSSLTTGINNTGVGQQALEDLTTGSRNTSIGQFAGGNISTGSYNTAVGSIALNANTTDSNSTAVGYYSGSGDFLTSGTYLGAYAGNINSSSKDYQTAVGAYSMNDCYGDNSTAVGYNAMSDGNHLQSVAVGYFALSRSLTSNPYYNVAVGANSNTTLYSADNTVAVGYSSQAIYDSSVGIGALAKAVGNNSVSLGAAAGNSFSTNSDSTTLIGTRAGFDLDGGDYCTFVGYEAGYAGGTGSYNTGIGRNALDALTTGNRNTSLGASSLSEVTSGNDNLGLGSAAGNAVTSGSNNILIGRLAGTSQGGVTTNGLTTGSNVVCLGFESMPSSSTATNEITLGDNNITSLRCNVQTISSLSDERDKTAIADIPYGLDFINDMRPVQFTWNRRDGSLGAKPDIGFIAQELHDVELNHSSSSRTRLVSWENPEKLEADYVRSYPILVKAVQELSAKCDALEARLAALEGA